MKIDIRKLKASLTLQDHEQILNSLDIPIVSRASGIWHLKSMCHSKTDDCGANLKLYTDTLTYTCFSHGCLTGGDIISLVQARKQLFCKSFTFLDSVNYIIDTLDLDIKKLERKTPKTEVFNWDKFFSKYLTHEQQVDDVQIYDDYVLKFFPKVYHQSFIDDGISIETMEKFELCYYPRNQQVVIPVRDEEMNFVGLHGRNLIPDKVKAGFKYQPVRMLDNTEYNFPTSMLLYGLGQNKESIKKTKTVRIFESPKAVMQMEDILEENNCVGLFGMNTSKYKRQLLLDLGIENVEICLDKQYKMVYNDNELTQEYINWQNQVNKIISLFKGYVNVSVVYDTEGLLDYKDSPSDKGKEVWDKLWKGREQDV